MRDFMSTERARWVFCMSVSSSPFGFQRPLCSTSTAASCTFCQPWKRPRWLSVPTAFGKAWCRSWKSISFQRCLPPRMKAMVSWSRGQVRAGSLARNLFQGCECVKFVMNIHAAVKPKREKQETVNMKRQPSLRGRPRGQVPSSQTHAQRQATKEWCAKRRGNHFFQNSLLHLPPAPSSGKWQYHSMAKSAPVSLSPKKWITGSSAPVKSSPKGWMGKGYFLWRQVHSSIAYWNSSGSQPNSPCCSRSTVLAWCRLCSSTNSSHDSEKKSLKGCVRYFCQV
mmetsp:Transcript_47529/g.147151  ORF Transcript_47529/g.147151 Transcript_47529/m.147151 type:complete len:281 (-) Transcript_47529:619-1461(-)